MKRKIKIGLITLLIGLLFQTACLDTSKRDINESVINSSILVINEIVAEETDDGKDWIELYVNGDKAVQLGDYSLVDDNEEREPAVLPDVTLEPGEFIVIQATDQEPEDGSYYVPFKLGVNDSVILYLGSDIVDILDWKDGDAPIGTSYGRLPDGTGEARTLTPTPGHTNMALEQEEQQ